MSIKPDWKTIFEEDMRALGLRAWRPWYRVTKRIAYFQYLLRKAEYEKGTVGFFARCKYLWTRWRLESLGERLGFEIPLYVFGPGLSIAHRGTIVVNGDARVGKGCRIHPGVTIGAIEGLAPTVEDYVFLGPAVGLFGPITVGRGSMIGPHALVQEDVPPGSIVVAARSVSRPRKKGPWRPDYVTRAH